MFFESNLFKFTYQGRDSIQRHLTELDKLQSEIDVKCSIKDGN